MNWYKLSQLSDIEIFEDKEHGMNYLNIGHRREGVYDYAKNFPNHIWVFHNGEVLSVEDSEHSGHEINAFPGSNINYEKSFSGRFESATGRLSVSRPSGISRYRPVPKTILYKLYQKFPSVKQIYVF